MKGMRDDKYDKNACGTADGVVPHKKRLFMRSLDRVYKIRCFNVYFVTVSFFFHLKKPFFLTI